MKELLIMVKRLIISKEERMTEKQFGTMFRGWIDRYSMSQKTAGRILQAILRILHANDTKTIKDDML